MARFSASVPLKVKTTASDRSTPNSRATPARARSTSCPAAALRDIPRARWRHRSRGRTGRRRDRPIRAWASSWRRCRDRCDGGGHRYGGCRSGFTLTSTRVAHRAWAQWRRFHCTTLRYGRPGSRSRFSAEGAAEIESRLFATLAERTHHGKQPCHRLCHPLSSVSRDRLSVADLLIFVACCAVGFRSAMELNAADIRASDQQGASTVSDRQWLMLALAIGSVIGVVAFEFRCLPPVGRLVSRSVAPWGCSSPIGSPSASGTVNSCSRGLLE